MGFFGNLFGTSDPWLIKGNELKRECQIETLTDAIKCYEKVIENDPRCIEAWYYKGHCYHLLRNEDDAIRCYDEAIKIKPNDAEVWYNKGMSFHCLNQIDDENFCFKKAIELNPSYKEYIEGWKERRGVELVQIGPNEFLFPKLPHDPRKWSK